MSTSKKHLSIAVASILSAGALASNVASAVPDQPSEWEKCAGVVNSGQNDCGALDGSHGCAGQAKMDNMDTEWVYVPKGTCEKLTGGKVAATKPAKS